jgi:hypothetical protein
MKKTATFLILLASMGVVWLALAHCPSPTAAAKPEINVKLGSADIASGTGTCAFSGVVYGYSGTMTITIENQGSADLELTGTPAVTIGGQDAQEFAVTTQPSSVIVPKSSSDFIITFTPASTGSKEINVEILNNDADEGSYTFSVHGTCVAPGSPAEIEVTTSYMYDIPSATGEYDFGSNANLSVTFYVWNYGQTALHLTGNPRVAISGANASEFVVTAQPDATVAGGSYYTSFTIQFVPVTAGQKEAQVSIANDDSDENPYTFTLKGSVAPEIEVTTSYMYDIPSGTGECDFGSNANLSVTFYVWNYGQTALHLTGNPRVAISGANASEFVVTAQPDATVAGGSYYTSFTIEFVPVTAGQKQAQVSIANDDSNENPYTFTVKGEMN